MKRRWIATTGVALAGVVLGLFLFPEIIPASWLFRVPSTRDMRLVGHWTRYWNYHDHDVDVSFDADGTGLVAGMRPFDWGTEGGRIFLRVHTVDSSYQSICEYRFEGAGISLVPIRAAIALGRSLIPATVHDFANVVPSKPAVKAGPYLDIAKGIAEKRGVLLSAVLKQPDPGFTLGYPGSRHWIVFPVGDTQKLFVVDCNTLHGKIRGTCWHLDHGKLVKDWSADNLWDIHDDCQDLDLFCDAAVDAVYFPTDRYYEHLDVPHSASLVVIEPAARWSTMFTNTNKLLRLADSGMVGSGIPILPQEVEWSIASRRKERSASVEAGGVGDSVSDPSAVHD